MARLIDWVRGLSVVASQQLTGPRAAGSSSNESLTGLVQTTASPFGALRIQVTVRPMRGQLYRRYRGMVDALHGGANAIRYPVCDPDGLTAQEAGIDATPAEVKAGVAWDNGMSWDNGQNWSIAKPWVSVAIPVAKDTDIVTLADEFWGYGLGIGDQFGFVPAHFGRYRITEVIRDGQYRVWPPLRKALTTDDWATLDPVIAMRLESEAAATQTRGSRLAEGNTITLVEVPDDIVREYFTD